MTKVVIITPINRYIGFSARISPVEQFTQAAQKLSNDIEVIFVDPQKSHIAINNNDVYLFDSNGQLVNGDVYFPFGHDLLDRNMTKYIIRALELSGKKVINGYDALTLLDDKALLAIELSKFNLPAAKTIIASARSNSNAIIEFIDGGKIISKASGFSAGGVGVAPIPSNIDYLAPILWGIRMDSRPKVLQSDLYKSNQAARTVIRAFVVGNEIVGCYTVEALGVVNCAGLAREPKVKTYNPTKEESKILINATLIVKSIGYCRIDAVGGNDKFAIIEINPLARIDVEKYGFDIPLAVLKYADKLNS